MAWYNVPALPLNSGLAANHIRAIARLRSQRLVLQGDEPRAALTDSLALGYFRPPLSGLSVCGFADT